MAATLTTIAKKAGVSLPLVSRFVNGDPSLRISHEKKLLIEETMRTCGGVKQRQKSHNRTSSNNLTYNIAIPHNRIYENEIYLSHMPRISYWTGLQDVLGSKGFHTSITFFEPDHELQIINQLVKSKTYCDGLILTGGMLNETSARLILDHGIPHISLDRNSERFGINTICGNTISGMEQAVEHLKSLGHSKIGYFAPIKAETARYTAYMTAIINAGLPLQEKLCCREPIVDGFLDSTERMKLSSNIFRKWLEEGCEATAIITNENFAIGAIQVLQEKNLKPGYDMSIIGYEDYTQSELPTPAVKLTTIYRNGWLLGKTAGERLLEQIINNRKNIIQERIHVQLIIGESTGKCRQQ